MPAKTNKFKWSNFLKPEILFLLIALFFGLINVFITPYGYGFDESAHIVRIWEISKFHFIPNDGGISTNAPTAFFSTYYMSQNVYIEPITWNEINQLFEIKINPYENNSYTTRAIYFPTLYIPAALIMGLFARVFNNVPILYTILLIRLVNLGIFAFLGYLSIKKIPLGKWLLLGLLLAPGIINISTNINTDYANLGISALFFSWVLFLIISEEQFSKKEFVIILLLILALFTLKINYSFLALLLLFIPKEKISFQKRLFLIFFTIFAFLLLVIGWNFLVLPNFDYSTQGINSFAQLTYIFSHPFIFIKILFQAILSNLKDLFQGWIGSYAYGIGIVPPIVYPLYLIGIVFLALFQYKERITTLALRITLVLLALCNVLFIFIVFYLTHTSVGETTISPVQGRYLFLAGLFFLMGICGFIKSKFTWVVRSFSSLLIIISLGLYSFGLFATYYVKCGSNLYMPGLCYLPFYQDWRLGVNSTGNLKEKYIVQQSFISQCKTIKEVSIKLAPNSENQGEIFFHFYDSNTNSLLASDVMEITNVVGEKLHFPIDVTNAEGKQFYFTLEGSQSTDSSPSFAITHDDNLEKMVLNGQIQNSNLIFQYGCSVK